VTEHLIVTYLFFSKCSVLIEMKSLNFHMSETCDFLGVWGMQVCGHGEGRVLEGEVFIGHLR
jgi:hypothetical protein